MRATYHAILPSLPAVLPNAPDELDSEAVSGQGVGHAWTDNSAMGIRRGNETGSPLANRANKTALRPIDYSLTP
jgi:hypothetical protein